MLACSRPSVVGATISKSVVLAILLVLLMVASACWVGVLVLGPSVPHAPITRVAAAALRLALHVVGVLVTLLLVSLLACWLIRPTVAPLNALLVSYVTTALAVRM